MNRFLALMGLAPGPLTDAPAPPTDPTPPDTKGNHWKMPDFIPKGDAEFAVWFAQFNTALNANLAALGLVAADVTPLTTAKTDLDAKIAANATAQDAAKAATAAKNTSRTNSDNLVRTLARRIAANPAVTPALKQQLGLTVRDTTRTTIVPVAPSTLAVEGRADGTNILTWSANGNKSGTQYIIEAKIGAATAFSQIDFTSKTTFNHTGQTPGVMVVYRVKARRTDMTSAPGNEAAIYTTTTHTTI